MAGDAYTDLISIDFESKGLPELQASLTKLDILIQKINRAMNGLKAKFDNGLISAEGFQRGSAKLESRLDGLKAKFAEGSARLDELQASSLDTTNSFRKMQGAILGFGLSILFFGMMVQKAFMSIARDSVDAFLKVSASASPAAHVLQSMANSMEYLKIVLGEAIGSALLPFLPIILDIVDVVGEWIQQNPELAAGLVLLGIVIGTILFFLGQIVLLAVGVGALLGSAFGKQMLAAVTTFIGKSGLLGVVLALGEIIAGAIILFAFFIALGKTMDYIGKVFKKISGATDETTDSFDSLNFALSFLKIIFDFVVGAFYIGMIAVFTALSLLFLSFAAIIVYSADVLKFQFKSALLVIELFGAGAAAALLSFISNFDFVLVQIARLINKNLIDPINSAIAVLNMFGANIPSIPRINETQFVDSFKHAADQAKKAFAEKLKEMEQLVSDNEFTLSFTQNKNVAPILEAMKTVWGTFAKEIFAVGIPIADEIRALGTSLGNLWFGSNTGLTGLESATLPDMSSLEVSSENLSVQFSNTDTELNKLREGFYSTSQTTDALDYNLYKLSQSTNEYNSGIEETIQANSNLNESMADLNEAFQAINQQASSFFSETGFGGTQNNDNSVNTGDINLNLNVNGTQPSFDDFGVDIEQFNALFQELKDILLELRAKGVTV